MKKKTVFQAIQDKRAQLCLNPSPDASETGRSRFRKKNIKNIRKKKFCYILYFSQLPQCP